MATKLFLVDIDLNGNKMVNCAVESLSTAPESPVQGRIYFNTTDNKFYYYTGSAWASGETVTAANLAGDQEGTQYGIYDTKTGSELKFRVIKTGDTRLKLAMADGVITATLDLKYQSAMPNELTVPNAVGGITAGTTAESLKGKTLDQVLDDLLFPEVQPTVGNPSASIALKGGFSANGIYEVGAAAPVNPTNFTTGFNQGNVTCPGKPNQKRAGALQSESSFIYYGGDTGETELPAKIVLGAMQYNYQASHAQGDTLVTSKGNKATVDPNPLPAGTVNSPAVTIYGTYPYFCNGASASSSAQDGSLPGSVAPDTKLPLVRWDATLVGAKFASEAATGTRLVFDFPATKNVTKVEFMNTVSGKWENFSGFTTSELGNKEIQSQQVAYKRLTTNGALSGALQLRFTIANA